MKKKGLLLIILSIVLGAGTFLGIFFYINKLNEQVDVVLAQENIPPYTEIKEEMLKIEKKPKYYVPEDIATKIEMVAGMYTGGYGLFTDDILCRHKVKNKEEIKDRILSNEIADGARAIAVKVDLTSSVAGIIREGDYVDISIVDDDFSVTPVESIKLLAVKNNEGENIEEGLEGKFIPSVVILEALTSSVRDTVVLVVDKGQVHLSLVKPSDVKETTINEDAVEKIQEKAREEATEENNQENTEEEVYTHF